MNNRVKLFLKFLILSAIGVFMFFIPITFNGMRTIPIEVVINYITSKFYPIVRIYSLLVILYAAIMPFKNKTWNKNKVSLIFSLTKILGAISTLLVFFNVGPEAILREDHGLFLFDSLVIQVGTLIPICSIFLTFLMNYGFIDFVGQFLRPIMSKIWKTPGKSSVDAIASFMGSTAMGILITNEMYRQRKYNTKEASIIVTGFSTVSVSFFVLVAKTANIMDYWDIFFASALFTTFAVTAIVARLKPLKSVTEEYHLGKEGFPEENVEGNIFKVALNNALIACENGGPVIPNVIKGVKDSFNLVFEILPNFMSIGLIALILAAYTSIFDIFGYVLYPLTLLLKIPEPLLASKAVFLGLAEMYLSVMLIKDAPNITRFIIAVISISQIIMFSTTVPAIVATDIPISMKDIFIIWLERTIISFLIIVPIANILI